MQDAQVFSEIHVDPQGRIDQDLTCVHCGYNLRGIDPKTRCPECGTPVGRSARGNLLEFSDPAWVERVARGMTWITVAIGAEILWAVIQGMAAANLSTGGVSTSQQEVLFKLLHQAFELIMLGGFWLFTVQDQADPTDEITSPRQIARYALTAAIIGSVIAALVGTTSGPAGTTSPAASVAVALCLRLARLVGLTAIFTYASNLALRIPDKPLARQTRIVMWGTIATEVLILTVVGIAALLAAAGGAISPSSTMGILTPCILLPLGLAMVIFGVWSIVIVINFQGKLRESALAARYTWAKEKSPQPTLPDGWF